MVGNPPDFWYHARRPAVVVPNGDAETLLAAADRYGVFYVVPGRNRPALLWDVPHPRLQPVAVWREGMAQVVLYRAKP